MKRGLKVYDTSGNKCAVLRYNRFPDEKGTESMGFGVQLLCNNRVTTVSPMKRGLKDQAQVHQREGRHRYNRFPDEKGTESVQRNHQRMRLAWLQPFPR